MGFNGTRQIINIPGNGAAYLNIVATGPVRYVKVVECSLDANGNANAIQGFTYLLPNDNFTQVQPCDPGTVMEIGDPLALRGPQGSIIGHGPDTLLGYGDLAASVLFEARSATGVATAIEVTQYY